uniref:Inositol-1(Or 4)-monophosphatase n=1 Tax=Beta vulgaris TaxID=161934 RepID=I6TC24_BETVU|nr:inositol-1(or 4)-monophosphatase [Beta vulgaris]
MTLEMGMLVWAKVMAEETTTAYGVKRTSNDNTWVVDPMLGICPQLFLLPWGAVRDSARSNN